LPNIAHINDHSLPGLMNFSLPAAWSVPDDFFTLHRILGVFLPAPEGAGNRI